MPKSRAACDSEPARAIHSSSSILPTPIERSLPKSTRKRTVSAFAMRVAFVTSSCRLSPGKQTPIDRQLPQADAGRCKERVGERRCCRDRARFADPAGCLLAADQMHLDGRGLVNAHDSIIIEITLLNATLVDCDLAIQSCAESEDEAALYLCRNRIGIDGDPTVHGADHASHLDLAIEINFGLGDRREIAAEHILYRDAAPDAWREGLAPTGL